MELHDGEPEAGPWRTVALGELVSVLERAAPAATGRPRVVAVDGRGGSGKSTLAAALHAAVPACAVVGTDDVAWHHSFFGWADLLADGVLGPVRRGQGVSYRPPAWDERGRDGAIEVPAGLDLVLVEGTGAGRAELTHLVDAVVWVRCDAIEAERRGIERDVVEGVGDAEQARRFWDEWQAQEVPFLAAQRPWERACAVVDGTPPTPPPAGHVVLALPPVP